MDSAWSQRSLSAAGATLVLVVCGCAGPRHPYRPTPLPTSIDRAADAVSQAAPEERAGSVSSRSGGDRSETPVVASASTTISGGSVSNEPELTALARDLKALSALDSQQQDRLLDDLRHIDPALSPHLIATLRAGLAYRRKVAADDDETVRVSDAPPEKPDLTWQSPDHARDAAATNHAPKGESNASDVAEGTKHAADARDVFEESGPRPAAHHAPAGGLSSPEHVVHRASRNSQVVHIADAAGEPQEPAPAAPLTADPPDGGAVALARFDRPAADLSVMDWRERMAAFVRDFESAALAAESPDVERELRLRFLYAISGRREEALRPIAGLPPLRQDFWAKQLYGLMALLDAQGDPNAESRAAEAALHLSDATARLREGASLVVRNLAFCTEVSSYGVYKPFDNYVFRPGQEVLLYAEVENFKSELVPEGYKTVLGSRYQILDKEGKQAEERDFGVTEEVCRNRRRDFFIRYQFALPDRIYDGAYTLKLTIEDQQGEKIGQGSIELTIKSK